MILNMYCDYCVNFLNIMSHFKQKYSNILPKFLSEFNLQDDFKFQYIYYGGDMHGCIRE